MKKSPKKASNAPAKKAAPKKAAAKKTPPKKPAPAKKPAAKPAKKAPAKKLAAPAKKAPAKKPAAPAKKAPAKKPAAPAKKAPAKKPAAPAKKAPAKKPASPAKKAPAKKPAAPAKKAPAKKPVAAKPRKPEPVSAPAPAPVAAPAPAPEAEEDAPAVFSLGTTYDRSKPFVSTLPPEIEPAVPSVDDDGDLFGEDPSPVGNEPANFSKKELAVLRDKMLAERNRLLGKAASLQAQSLTRADEVNPEEDGTDASMRISELAKAEGAEGLVNQIDAALRAIEAGTYGVCQACGGPIRKARMKAYPFATLCVSCQHEAEADTARRNAPQASADYL